MTGSGASHCRLHADAADRADGAGWDRSGDIVGAGQIMDLGRGFLFLPCGATLRDYFRAVAWFPLIQRRSQCFHLASIFFRSALSAIQSGAWGQLTIRTSPSFN